MKTTMPAPFPSMGEVLRTITLALDSKNASTKITNKKFDEFARGEDINWHLKSEIIERHIYLPLQSSTNEDFAQYIGGFVEYLTDSYLELVKNQSVDNLNREQVIPVIAEDFFAMQSFELLDQLQREFSGPQLAYLLSSPENMFKLIFDWFRTEGSTTLHKLAYPSTCGDGKNGRDNFTRWINGEQIPDASSLTFFIKSLKKNQPSLDDEKLNTLKVWLQIARAFTWFEKEFNEYPIRKWMKRYIDDLKYIPNVCLSLDHLVQVESKRLNPTFELAAKISMGLEPSVTKPINAQEWLKEKLIQFEALLKIHDPDETMKSFVEWNWGRWYVLAGEYEKAIPHYATAFDYAHYRAGTNQKKIIKESLVLAGYTADTTFLKRMKNYAIAFNLLKSPATTNSEVVEQWEYEQLARQFKEVFPNKGYFSGSFGNDTLDEGLPFLLFDEDTIKSKEADLRKPDRVIKIIAADGQVRRYPQLRFFASWGVTDAVSRLLKRGASVDKLDEHGASALLCAIQHADQTSETEVLEMLLQQPHQKITLNRLTQKKQINPLFCAVEYGEPKLVEQLLKMGASVDIKGNLDAKTPLYMCLEQIGCLLKPNLLLNLFENAVNGHLNLHQKDAMRRFGVISADIFGEIHTLKITLQDPEKLAKLKEKVEHFIDKIESHWSLPKLLNIVELLLEHGAQPNEAHSYPIRGFTPLMLAAENDSLESFQMMLRFGGNPYKDDSLGRNALQIAREFNSNKVLTFHLTSNDIY
jgi:ankyrin repeat protein/tetratricopeptide (TPR) repeat protein